MSEKKFINDLKDNYIKSMAHHVASNIDSVFRNFGNNSIYSYEQIYNTSQDFVALEHKEKENINKQVQEILKDKYGLKIIYINGESKLSFEKVM